MCNIRGMRFTRTVRQHHRKSHPLVTKNKLTDKDKMNCSNNNNYVLKCYINLFYVVSDEMEQL